MTATLEAPPETTAPITVRLPRRRAPTPRLPKPPRRPPTPPRERAPLTVLQVAIRGIVAVAAALLLAFTANVTLVSQIQHFVAQQQLSNTFLQELSDGTAPVSEADYQGALLPDGAPVALIEIPQLGMREVVSEGSSADVLRSGPGHRRDTVLPGQAGTSVLMGRQSAYGGPFGQIEQLAPGDTFTVVTGQGKEKFSVLGVRYAGDPTPAAPASGQSRLILETARGPGFAPTGIAYVDAELTTKAEDPGARQTTRLSLPAQDAALASDTSTVWALVFALQFLIAVEIGAVWAYRRVGARKTWVVFVPTTVLAVLFVASEVTILLPNLL